MNVRSEPRILGLDELPRYTTWIPYLLGLEAFPHTLRKTADSVLREYERNKWGILLGQLRRIKDASIADADRLSSGERRSVSFYANGGLYVADSDVVQNKYFQLIRDELQTVVGETGHLVELGAGYGALLFKLCSLRGFTRVAYTAGEYTDAGVSCIKLLAANQGLTVQAGHCDLNDLNLSAFAIPENAIFLTCWAMAYVKGFPRRTMEEIIRRQPAAVVHIEPIYEHWSNDSLLQMLWRRYAELNDYNRSMMTMLRTYEMEGLIEIVDERPSVFGSNPLAPVSIVRWKPRG
ncbi:hypothetical protein [Castellaniella sp. UC4442_H9]